MAILLDRLVRHRVLRATIGGQALSPNLHALLLSAARLEFERGGVRSTTSALRDVVLAVHATLRERNLDGLLSDRRYLAAACAVQGGEGIYIALAGTACAYHIAASEGGVQLLHNERLSRLPQPSLLGGQASPMVMLRLIRMAPEDRLLLVAGSGAERPNELKTPWDRTPQEIVDALTVSGTSSATLLDANCAVLAERIACTDAPPPRPIPAVTAAMAVAGAESADESEAARPPWRPGPLTAATGTLIVFVLALGYWLGRAEPTPDEQVALGEVSRLLEQAERSSQSPQAAHAVVLAREALAQVDEEQVPPQLTRRMRAASERAFAVERLDEPRARVEFEPGRHNVAQMHLAADAVFLVEAVASSLHRFRFGMGQEMVDLSAHTPLVSRGDALEGRTLGHPLALAGVADGAGLQPSPVVMVDTERTFSVFEADQLAARFAPPGSAAWGQIGPTAGAEGRLYLVDAVRGMLLEYRMTGSAASQPRVVLRSSKQVDLSGSVSLAAGRDDLYVLFGNGDVRRFDLEGRSRPFAGSLPDRPLDAPMSLALGQRSERVYVADSANERVVQFSPDGQFLRQFRAREGQGIDLAGLRAVAVDEWAQRLLCLTPHRLIEYRLSQVDRP